VVAGVEGNVGMSLESLDGVGVGGEYVGWWSGKGSVDVVVVVLCCSGGFVVWCRRVDTW
jgi:hypothetical protein